MTQRTTERRSTEQGAAFRSLAPDAHAAGSGVGRRAGRLTAVFSGYIGRHDARGFAASPAAVRRGFAPSTASAWTTTTLAGRQRARVAALGGRRRDRAARATCFGVRRALPLAVLLHAEPADAGKARHRSRGTATRAA